MKTKILKRQKKINQSKDKISRKKKINKIKVEKFTTKKKKRE